MKKKKKIIKKNPNKAQIKSKIREFLTSFDGLFQIQHYEKEICFSTTDKNLLADILFDEKYQRLTLTIYPEYFNITPEQQVKTLIHELIHTITIPSEDLALTLIEGNFVTKKQVRDLNEKQTSQIENIFNGLLSGKMNYAFKAYREYLK